MRGRGARCRGPERIRLQRPPRLVLVGPNGAGKAELLAALFGTEVFQPGEENLSDGHWQTIGRTAGRGSLRLLRGEIARVDAHELLSGRNHISFFDEHLEHKEAEVMEV